MKLSNIFEDPEWAKTVVGKYIRRARYIFGQGTWWEIADGLAAVVIVAAVVALIITSSSLYAQVTAGAILVVYVLDQKYDFSDKARRFNKAVQAAFKARGYEYMRQFPESAPALELIFDAIDETTVGGPNIFRGRRLSPEMVKNAVKAHPESAEHLRDFLEGSGMMTDVLRAVFNH